MEISLALVGQLGIINFIVIILFTLKFAKGNADNLIEVGIFSALFNIFFFPVGWFYCWLWSNRDYQSKQNGS